MVKNIIAGVVGIIVAVGIIWAIESLGHRFYPPPAGLDFADAEAMRVYVNTLPLGALLFVPAAWFIGTLGGTFVACRIGTASRQVFALAVGGLVLAATVVNLVMIPHPMWFSVLGVAAVLVGAWLGAIFGGRRDSTG